MNILQALQNRGFVEGVDFTLNNEDLQAIEKFIHHDAIAEVLDPETQEVLVEAQDAWDESYYEPIPSIADLKQDCILASDITLLIEEYLKDKQELRDYENDEINIYEGKIFRWGFANISQPTVDELYALIDAASTSADNHNLIKSKIALGKAARAACENVLDLIAGFNLDRELTAEQINTMTSTFGTIMQLLMANRPSSAKALISAVTPDEELVTQEMIDLCLELLADF